jgi:hypothetical protein
MPQGLHWKTSMLSCSPRQIVRTYAMGFPHEGQGIDFKACTSFVAILNDTIEAE